MTRDTHNLEIVSPESSENDNNKTREVMGNPQCDIAEKPSVDGKQIEPNSFIGAKPCERSVSLNTAIRQAKRTYWVDQGGVVIFDRTESVDHAESIRHNR
jgi:hypothetical protein